MKTDMLHKLAIFGVPRSGTSWLAQMFNSHPDVVMRFQPLFSYAHKNQLDEHATGADIEQFYQDIHAGNDPFAGMTAPHFAAHPKDFQKNAQPTHICFKEAQSLHIIENMLAQCPDLRVMGICRSPMAVLASWMQAPREFSPHWDIHEEWRSAPGKNNGNKELYFGYDKWKEGMQIFVDLARRYPQQFVLVKYDALLRAPHAVMRNLFDFCGLGWDRQVENFIVQSQSKHDDDPHSVYRIKTHDEAWTSVLPDDIAKTIEQDLRGSKLEQLLGRNLPASLHDYLERPKTLAPDDYWGQVRRTIQGKAVPEEQIAILRDTLRRTLQLAPHDVLLDLCCGNGALTAPFFDELAGYLGVDLSPILIGVAQKFFQRTGTHEYILSDVTDFLSEEKCPERFTLCAYGSAFQYFSPDEARKALRLLRTRFANLRKVFLCEIPNAEKAASFFHNTCEYPLHDHTSAIGIWYRAEELLAMAAECGWKALIQYFPDAYCQAHYRFNLVLTH
jgi:SAM-dependent methyltransferase